MASELMAKDPTIDDYVIKNLGCRISPMAMYWPFEVLQRNRGVPDDVAEVSVQSADVCPHFIALTKA